VINEDGRDSSCVSIGFKYLGIDTNLIEALQKIEPLHTIEFPLWLRAVELCSRGSLQPYEWHGTLQEFMQQHPTGKFLTIIEVTSEEDVSKRQTHAVAVVDGISFNVSNTERQVFRVWKAQN
jgi:hypothetical protein